MRATTAALLATLAVTAAACSLPGQGAPKSGPSVTRTPFSFPSGYSPSPYRPGLPSASPTLAAGRPDACSLLTADDVKEAMGSTPRTPVMRDLGNVVRCTWANSDYSRVIYVEVFARAGQDAAAARALYDQNHHAAAHPVEVDGVAEAAFTARYYAFALKGVDVLKVTYQEPHYPDIDPGILRALVTHAGGRLQ